MKRKKYLLIIDALGSGGAERQLKYLANCLRENGHDIKLITFYDSPDFYNENKNDVYPEVHLEGQSPIKRPFVIRRIIKRFKPDMVIAYKDGSAMASCLAKIFMRFRLIVSERNTTQILNIKERIKFWLYKLADHIVPNSFTQAEFIETNYPTLKSKITVITNMIDLRKFNNKRTLKESSPLRVLTAARIVPQKNVHNYLKAIGILKEKGINMKFDWFGNDDKDYPEYFESVLDLRSQLGLDEIVKFYPAKMNIETEYMSHDIFLLPSKYEGFPNVLCEAMACGLPSVATAVCDSSRILTDENYLADPDSPNSIAVALENIYKLSFEERLLVGEQNSNRISYLCSQSEFYNKYTSLD